MKLNKFSRFVSHISLACNRLHWDFKLDAERQNDYGTEDDEGIFFQIDNIGYLVGEVYSAEIKAEMKWPG
jgi:hypothetical protein